MSPVYRMIVNRQEEILGWKESSRIPIRVLWTKERKALIGVKGESGAKVDARLNLAADLYGGMEIWGTVVGTAVGLVNDNFIKVRFEKMDGNPFDVLLTDRDIVLVC